MLHTNMGYEKGGLLIIPTQSHRWMEAPEASITSEVGITHCMKLWLFCWLRKIIKPLLSLMSSKMECVLNLKFVECWLLYLLSIKIFLNLDLESINQHIFPPILVCFRSFWKYHLDHQQHEARKGEHYDMPERLLTKDMDVLSNSL